MQQNVLLIGYRLNDALLKLPHDKDIIVEMTKAPHANNENDQDLFEPIVVRQIEDEQKIVLTVSYFK